MITPRENYLIAAHGGMPEWVPDMWEDTVLLSFNKYDRHFDEDGVEWDSFGISYEHGFPTKGKFWEDITDWRKYQFPDLSSFDWEEDAKEYAAMTSPDKATSVHLGDGGMFLTLANAMGFTDALISLIEEPDEVKAFWRAYTDYVKTSIDYAVKYMHVDVINFPDDTANGRGPFMSQETYEDLYEPFLREIVEHVHAHNLVFDNHNCGDPQYQLEKYLDMGIEIVNANIDSPYLREFREKHGPRALCLEGGWKNTGDFASNNASEEAVKRAVDEYYAKFAAGGGFISHINMIVEMGDKEAMVRKVLWGQEQSNKIRFEYYGKKTEDQLQRLSQYTHGMDIMLEAMLNQ